MRTEAGKMPESLVFPIRNGLGVSNDRFGLNAGAVCRHWEKICNLDTVLRPGFKVPGRGVLSIITVCRAGRWNGGWAGCDAGCVDSGYS